MTVTIAQQVARRVQPELVTFREAWAQALESKLREAHMITWPSDRYRDDPVAFFREILGVQRMWDRQIEIIEAVRDHKRVAVSSGHKISKSFTAAGIALWFYCSFPEARVVMSSTTSRQVDQILWRELRMMCAKAGRCAACKDAAERGPVPCEHSAAIDGEIHELARSGLKSPDFREVVGFTAREAEAVAGISGKNLLYILDEASGIPDEIFEAIEGNRAGGARVVMFSNPTRTVGEFFEAFESKKAFYKTLQISSEETPNVRERREVIPGLATYDWVEEKRQEWGEDSPLFKVRVKGQFVLKEEGKILSLHAITMAEMRWEETLAEGRLCVGFDPAGPGEQGDESALAARRGLKIIEIRTTRGLDEEAHIPWLLAFLKAHREPREKPVVLVDREGSVGAKVWGFLQSHVANSPNDFELYGIRSSEKAPREPHIYDRWRDELYANFELWIRQGGSIPEDARLAKELHFPDWSSSLASHGRLKATPKKEIRKALGRSPDRADACMLAAWEPSELAEATKAKAPPEAPADPISRGGALDPYGGINPFAGPGGMDPYGGQGGHG